MKYKFQILPIFILLFFFNKSIAEETKNNNPLKLKIGLYVTQIFNLNSNSDNFQADLWLWVNYKGEMGDYFDLLEFFNSIDSKRLIRDTEKVEGGVWDSAKYSNKISTSWDVSNFPFDKQKLEIMVEIGKATSEIILEPDAKDSGVNPAINLDEWKITNSSIRSETIKYPTAFGSPKRNEPEEYSRIILEIDIVRNSMSLFFKLHAGIYVAFCITMLSYFMNPKSDDIFSGRVSLVVGMLFACLVNMQIVESTVGKTNYLSLSDKIHILTMVNIFISVCVTKLSRFLCDIGIAHRSKLFDRICIIIQSIVYVIFNLILIFSAMS